MNLDLELKLFIEHSSLRWLSIGSAVRRILEPWQAIEQFVKFLESDPKRIPQSAAFKRVQAAIKRNEILVQLNFIASTVTLFETFMLNFQNDEPKIHVLYKQMVDLIKTFILSFMKGEAVEDKDITKPDKDTRVDHYWRRIFKLQKTNGNSRYPLLTRIVKTALVLPHGNSDVERGISVNSRMLTNERNKLFEVTINRLRATKT